MTEKRSRYLWFLGIYVVSVLGFAGFTYLLRWLLKAI